MFTPNDIPENEDEYFTRLFNLPTESDEERFENLCSVYRHMFGETFVRGYGSPETYQKCITLLESCIKEGHPHVLKRGVIY